PERLPVLHHDREDRAELDHDVEHRPLRGVVAEQLRGENQVASGGDRDELGQALGDAEQDGGEGQSHACALLAERAAKSTARPHFHQMCTRSSGGRSSASSGVTSNASYQASMLRTTPLTRASGGLCTSVNSRCRAASSRVAVRQTCAQAMKNRWSPVKPSITGGSLPLSDMR